MYSTTNTTSQATFMKNTQDNETVHICVEQVELTTDSYAFGTSKQAQAGFAAPASSAIVEDNFNNQIVSGKDLQQQTSKTNGNTDASITGFAMGRFNSQV